MQLGMRKIVFFAGGVCVVGGALVAAACSSSSSTSSGGVPNVDANTDTGSTPPPPPPPPPPPGSGDGGDGGVDCMAVPKIRDNTNGFYCAFAPTIDAGPDGGNDKYCSATEVCCNTSATYADGGHYDSYCATDSPKPATDEPAVVECTAGAATANGGLGSAWDGGDTWECADKNNCPSGDFCVAYAESGKTLSFATLNKNNGKDITGCGAIYAKNIGGTKCVAGNYTLAAGELHLCGKTDDCVGGSTCTPFSGFFRDLAYCK